MHFNPENSFETEIDKLEALGWQDWPVNNDGLRIKEYVDENLISFPKDSYESFELSQLNNLGTWEEIRASKILNLMNKHNIDTLWEIGAGNGSVSRYLSRFGKVVYCVEPLKSGASTLAKLGFTTFWGTLESLQLPNSSVQAIGLFDVLEHIEDPAEILSEVNRCLEPGGYLILTVPANNWLFSDFDISIGHFRRYSRKKLNLLLKGNNFSVLRIDYFFMILVLPALILRAIPYRLGRRRNITHVLRNNTNQSKILALFKPFILASIKFEELLRIPTGLSLVAISRKSKATITKSEL